MQCIRPHRASPSDFFPKQTTPQNYQTGSKPEKCSALSSPHSLRRFRLGSRVSKCMSGNRAGRRLADRASGVAAARRANRFNLDVQERPENIAAVRRRRVSFVIVDCPLMFGTVDGFQVGDTGRGLGRRLSAEDIGNNNPEQDAQDGNGDHNLRQSEGGRRVSGPAGVADGMGGRRSRFFGAGVVRRCGPDGSLRTFGRRCNAVH